MAENRVHEVPVNDPLLKAQGFWKRYQKAIIGVFAVIVIAIAGWLGYKNFIVAPKEERAQEAIFKAQQYFAKDSVNLALNGDGVNKGFAYIINNYGGTKTANLAKYYAGVCNLKLGNYANAIKYLNDFNTDARQVQMMAYGCLGDAYSESKKNTEAVDAYKKAASTFEEDAVNSSEYLFRAALLSEVMGKNKEALDLYKELQQKFPATEKGEEAQKYIYRLSIEPNDLSVK